MTETINRHVNNLRARLNARCGVGHRETEFVMTVQSDLGLRTHDVVDESDCEVNQLRCCVSSSVGYVYPISLQTRNLLKQLNKKVKTNPQHVSEQQANLRAP